MLINVRTLQQLLALSLLVGGFAACEGDGGDESDPTSGVTASRTRPLKPTAQPTASSTLRWSSCEDEDELATYECTTVEVPVDHEDPDGDKVSLQVLRLPAADPASYIGPLFVNPGGPGASAVTFARDAPYLFPREIIDRFDIIGVDTRGIGNSEGINCRSDDDVTGLDFTPEDEEELAALEDFYRDYAEACDRWNDDILPFMDTLSAARDLDLVREALGAEQISFIGYSYGTVLGAAYADLFPDRVRAAVLDGVFAANLSFDQRLRDSAVAFERALQAFLDDCAARRACDYFSEGDPHGAYDDLLRRLEAEPIPALWYDDTTTTADDVRAAVTASMYDRADWIQLAFALVAADRDEDGTLILDIAYPYSDPEAETNQGDASNAIACVDSLWPDDSAAFATLADDLRSIAPRVGAGNVFYDLACAFWSAPAKPLPAFDAEGAPPILVIGATGDTATPYEWAQQLADQLESAVLLTYEGYTHTASFGGISDCVDEAALLYLVDLTPPAHDTTC